MIHFHFLIKFIINIIFLIKKKKLDFSSTDLYQDCLWGNLSIGDIVLIRRKEKFPGTALLLDTENEYCLCDSFEIDGATSMSKRFPLKLTSRLIFSIKMFLFS